MSNAVVARELRRVLRRQNSAIHGRQLRAAGLTRPATRARVVRGALVAVFQDVYVAGDPELLPLARESAALLSLGPASLLSHRSAAAVWGFAVKARDSIDVTVVNSHPRAREGVVIHRVKALAPADITTNSNLRITSPARTMIDFLPRPHRRSLKTPSAKPAPSASSPTPSSTKRSSATAGEPSGRRAHQTPPARRPRHDLHPLQSGAAPQTAPESRRPAGTPSQRPAARLHGRLPLGRAPPDPRGRGLWHSRP